MMTQCLLDLTCSSPSKTQISRIVRLIRSSRSIRTVPNIGTLKSATILTGFSFRIRKFPRKPRQSSPRRHPNRTRPRSVSRVTASRNLNNMFSTIAFARLPVIEASSGLVWL